MRFLTKLLVFGVTIGCSLSSVLSNENGTCSMEMFGNDFSAYMACITEFAHQSNWFPSPIAGLFSYQIWNGYDGFWQNGAVLEPMANFMEYAQHKRYLTVVTGSQRDLYSLMEAYGPYPSFDDMGWFGLSYARIYELFSLQEFLQTAIDILNWSWKTGWDSTGQCNGGMWFDNNFNAKQTITDVQMYHLAAKLYRLTNNTEFRSKYKKIEEYIFSNNLINSSTFLLSDGIDLNSCKPSNSVGFTYETGIMMGAFSEMYKLTNNDSYLILADKIATAAIQYNSNASGIFTEKNCDPDCDDDAKMFKGIFVRNLRYFMDTVNDTTIREKYQKWMEFQVQANIKHNMCNEVPISRCNITFKDGPPYFKVSGPVFSPDWNGPFTNGAPMQQTSVLDLFVASIRPGTKCSGIFCNYDPHVPPPQPMTCGSHPCPAEEECCEYSPYTSYTCCEKSQKCNKQGICV
ncbi:uncharacterized protein LOC133181504 [Saccostrea echinata]|uniref:uncharacterized protein LOC133181504 n=1 Tax=Saccostrea echinata TaxID=191078 RepID=UPI002A8214A7|nr:uncharacterized protein LOC133181504 [Saccostrea echinata]